MLTIRLQRTGTKNRASFRVVLAEAYRAAGKQAIEVLGHYNPKTKELGIKNQDRLMQLIKQHTQVSPTVYNLLVEKKLVTGKKVKAWQPKKKSATGNEGGSPAQAASGSEAPAAESAPAEAAPAVEPQA